MDVARLTVPVEADLSPLEAALARVPGMLQNAGVQAVAASAQFATLGDAGTAALVRLSSQVNGVEGAFARLNTAQLSGLLGQIQAVSAADTASALAQKAHAAEVAAAQRTVAAAVREIESAEKAASAASQQAARQQVEAAERTARAHHAAAVSQAEASRRTAISQVSGLAGQAGAAMTRGGQDIVSHLAAAIQVTGEYQSSLNVLQSTAHLSNAEMKQADELAIKLGADQQLPATSAKTATDAMLGLARAGVTHNDIFTASRPVLQLMAAGHISAEKAATLAGRALNIFHLQGSQANTVVDVMASLVSAAGSQIVQTGEAFRRGGSAAQQAGVGIHDFGTELGLMARAGITGGAAGTQIAAMLKSIESPSAAARAEMQRLGFSLFDTTGHMKDQRTIIAELGGAINGLSERGRIEANNTIFSSAGRRAANVILLGGVEAYDRMSKKVGEAGSAQALADARMKGYVGSVENFNSQIETLQINVGRQLLPAVTQGVVQVSHLVEQFNALSEDQKGSIVKTVSVIGGLLLLSGPIASSVSVVGTLVNVWKSVETAAILARVAQESAARVPLGAGGAAAGLAGRGAYAGLAGVPGIVMPAASAAPSAALGLGPLLGIAAVLAGEVVLLKLAYDGLNGPLQKSNEALVAEARGAADAATHTAAHVQEVTTLTLRYNSLHATLHPTSTTLSEMQAVLDKISVLSPSLVAGYDAQGHALRLVRDAAREVEGSLAGMSRAQQIAQTRVTATETQGLREDRARLNAELQKQKFLLEHHQAVSGGLHPVDVERNPDALNNPLLNKSGRFAPFGIGGDTNYSLPNLVGSTSAQDSAYASRIREIQSQMAALDRSTTEHHQHMRAELGHTAQTAGAAATAVVSAYAQMLEHAGGTSRPTGVGAGVDPKEQEKFSKLLTAEQARLNEAQAGGNRAAQSYAVQIRGLTEAHRAQLTTLHAHVVAQEEVSKFHKILEGEQQRLTILHEGGSKASADFAVHLSGLTAAHRAQIEAVHAHAEAAEKAQKAQDKQAETQRKYALSVTEAQSRINVALGQEDAGLQKLREAYPGVSEARLKSLRSMQEEATTLEGLEGKIKSVSGQIALLQAADDTHRVALETSGQTYESLSQDAQGLVNKLVALEHQLAAVKIVTDLHNKALEAMDKYKNLSLPSLDRQIISYAGGTKAFQQMGQAMQAQATTQYVLMKANEFAAANYEITGKKVSVYNDALQELGRTARTTRQELEATGDQLSSQSKQLADLELQMLQRVASGKAGTFEQQATAQRQLQGERQAEEYYALRYGANSRTGAGDIDSARRLQQEVAQAANEEQRMAAERVLQHNFSKGVLDQLADESKLRSLQGEVEGTRDKASKLQNQLKDNQSEITSFRAGMDKIPGMNAAVARSFDPVVVSLQRTGAAFDALSKSASEAMSKIRFPQGGFAPERQGINGSGVASLMQGISGSDGSIYSQAHRQGVFAGDGFAQGVMESAQAAAQASGAMAQRAIDTVSDMLGIQSPSRVFATIGQYTVDGLAVGIKNGTRTVAEAASGLVRMTVSQAMAAVPSTQSWKEIAAQQSISSFFAEQVAMKAQQKNMELGLSLGATNPGGYGDILAEGQLAELRREAMQYSSLSVGGQTINRQDSANQLSGNVTHQYFNMTIHTPDVAGFQMSRQQIMQQMYEEGQTASRRNG